MTRDGVFILTQDQVSKFKITKRRIAKFVSNLNLFMNTHWMFLLHTKNAYLLRVCHDFALSLGKFIVTEKRAKFVSGLL